MQSEINDIHKKIGEKNSFVYSYVMGCPKSTTQLLEEQKDTSTGCVHCWVITEQICITNKNFILTLVWIRVISYIK
jgi:hypothetical protein